VEELREQAVDVRGLVRAVVGDVQLDEVRGDVVIGGDQHLDLVSVDGGIVWKHIRGRGHGLEDIHLVVRIQRSQLVHPREAHHRD
jgi:hypothetical protein